jgi:hypothetical protein
MYTHGVFIENEWTNLCNLHALFNKSSSSRLGRVSGDCSNPKFLRSNEIPQEGFGD